MSLLLPQLTAVSESGFLTPGLVRGGGDKGVQSTGARHVLRGPVALMLEELFYVGIYCIVYTVCCNVKKLLYTLYSICQVAGSFSKTLHLIYLISGLQ